MKYAIKLKNYYLFPNLDTLVFTLFIDDILTLLLKKETLNV